MFLVKFKYDFLKDFVPLCKTMNDPTGRLLEPGGGGGMAPPNFNPIATKGANYAHHITTRPPPRFLDLPSSLYWTAKGGPPENDQQKVQCL